MSYRFGHVASEGDSTLTRSLRRRSGDARWRRGIATLRAGHYSYAQNS